MTSGNVVQAGAGAAQVYGSSLGGGTGHEPANLGDILERVLDKGLVIAGDIQINLLDIELLTIKLRLVIASLETAREVGINWWENDPWLSAQAMGASSRNELQDQQELQDENRRLQARIRALESGNGDADHERTGHRRAR